MLPRSHEKRFFPTVPYRPYPDMRITEIRAGIDSFLARSSDVGVLNRLDGINVVKSRDFPREMTCYQFLFGADTILEIDRLIKDGVRTLHDPGAIAFYFNRGHRGRFLRHVGLVLPNGNVLSKWGDKAIFEHHPDFLPRSYGRIRGYYVDKSGMTLKRVRDLLPELDCLNELT